MIPCLSSFLLSHSLQSVCSGHQAFQSATCGARVQCSDQNKTEMGLVKFKVERFMDFCGRMGCTYCNPLIRYTGSFLRVFKKYMMVSDSWIFYGESRLSGTLISSPHFEELGCFQLGCPCLWSVPVCQLLNTFNTRLVELSLRKLS